MACQWLCYADIDTSAKSEVVTVCSWQFAGEERLQSTAMILITKEEPHL
jgi:hypothetical protein